MPNEDVSAEVAEAQKLEDLTGMGIPVEDTSEPESEVKIIPKAKPEEKAEEAESEDDVEDNEDEDKGKVEPKEKSIRPAKNDRPIRALFKQIGDLSKGQEQLATIIKGLQETSTKKEQAETVDEIAELAKRRDLDPEGLKELRDILEKNILDGLEKSGKLNRELPKDIEAKLALLDQIQEEKNEIVEKANFENEWSAFVPTLQKQYPNAKASELAAAKELLDEIAHSEEGGVVVKKATATEQGKIKPYPLDFIIYKNKSKFDTILKVAKGIKSGEDGSKQIEEFNDEDDIDLDPETMDPEKMKRYQKKKYGTK